MEAKELGAAIERAITSLRPEYRSCILLRHVEGRSYEEIAATLDLPLGTVKTYIHRARHELRRALEHLRDDTSGACRSDADRNLSAAFALRPLKRPLETTLDRAP